MQNAVLQVVYEMLVHKTGLKSLVGIRKERKTGCRYSVLRF